MLVVIKNAEDHQQDHDSRHSHDYFDQARKYRVNAAAKISRDDSQHKAKPEGHQHRFGHPLEADLTTIEQAAQHISAKLVSAEQMLAGRRGQNSGEVHSLWLVGG